MDVSFFTAIFLLNLKVMIRTVIIKNLRISAVYEMTIAIEFGLDIIRLACKDRKRTIHVMKIILRLFQKSLCKRISALLAGRIKDTGIDHIKQDILKRIFIIMAIPDIPANIIETQIRA